MHLRDHLKTPAVGLSRLHLHFNLYDESERMVTEAKENGILDGYVI